MSNKEIYNYIEDNMNKGYSKEKLRDTLEKIGYDGNFISSIFDEINEKKNKKILGIFPRRERFEPKETPHPDYQPNITTNDEEEGGGINKKIDSINSKLNMLTAPDVKKSYKQFKLPSKIKKQLKKLAEKGKILVILFKTNRSIQPIITDVIDGFINVNGTPHNCSTDFVYLWKGKYPCIGLQEWDLNPIGTNDYYEAVKEKRVAAPVAVVMRMIKSGENLIGKEKFQLSPAWVIGGIAIIAVIYLVMTGGK